MDVKDFFWEEGSECPAAVELAEQTLGDEKQPIEVRLKAAELLLDRAHRRNSQDIACAHAKMTARELGELTEAVRGVATSLRELEDGDA